MLEMYHSGPEPSIFLLRMVMDVFLLSHNQTEIQDIWGRGRGCRKEGRGRTDKVEGARIHNFPHRILHLHDYCHSY